MESFLRGKRIIRSRYEEDVMINDHLCVWGSWYNKHLGWGYGCCFSTEKHSYCAGMRGRERALAKEFKIKAEEARSLQQLKDLEKQAAEEEKNEDLKEDANEAPNEVPQVEDPKEDNPQVA
jgi:pre-mRNA-processing factor SLU7